MPNIIMLISELDELLSNKNLSGAEKLLASALYDAEKSGSTSEMLTILSEQIGLFRKLGKSGEGINASLRAIALLEESGQAGSVSGATILLNAATALKAFGKASEALPYYEKTLEVYKNNLSDDDERFGGFYNNYAFCLMDLKRYSDAENAFLSAAALMEEKSGCAYKAAVTYVNMTDLYALMEKSGEEIVGLMEKAIELFDDYLNVRDGDYYYALSKCLPAIKDMGFDSDATAFQDELDNFYNKKEER
ncbi:MAG: tetratricopeptide repeat protein [Oscillospiraceae bacterium]|nr:tetratricopeptide repeat protein [Oscillospiraceae bacterium]